jgi:hypothetical protein
VDNYFTKKAVDLSLARQAAAASYIIDCSGVRNPVHLLFATLTAPRKCHEMFLAEQTSSRIEMVYPMID